MAMFQSSKLPVAALLLLSASLASAQDAEPVAEEQDAEAPKEAEAPPPEDFIQKGQIVAVSEEDIDEGSDDYDVPELTESDLLESEFELFKELMRENVLDEADTVAKRVVELAISCLLYTSDAADE